AKTTAAQNFQKDMDRFPVRSPSGFYSNSMFAVRNTPFLQRLQTQIVIQEKISPLTSTHSTKASSHQGLWPEVRHDGTSAEPSSEEPRDSKARKGEAPPRNHGCGEIRQAFGIIPGIRSDVGPSGRLGQCPHS